MSLSQTGAAISLFFIIIGIVAFFFPGGWLVSAAMFVIVVTIWITGFTWRIATAADNIIEKYQDDNMQYRHPVRYYNDSDKWSKT